jgi:deoxyadenosine/deoxycytidine kinase
VEGPSAQVRSTLAGILAASWARAGAGEPEEKPFFAPFYKDPRRHALSLELFFLLQRYRQQAELAQGDLFSQGGVVADYLFAKDRLFATLTLTSHELALYDRIYQTVAPRAVTRTW